MVRSRRIGLPGWSDGSSVRVHEEANKDGMMKGDGRRPLKSKNSEIIDLGNEEFLACPMFMVVCPRLAIVPVFSLQSYPFIPLGKRGNAPGMRFFGVFNCFFSFH